jgi:mono/diheme cytochrome c family protein
MKRIRCSLFFIALGFGMIVCRSAHGQVRPPASTVLPVTTQGSVVPPPATHQPPPANPSAPQTLPPMDSVLAFDAGQKEVSVTNGTPEAHFTFSLTNITTGDVIINFVQPSCGCTVAKLPPVPWKIPSKGTGEISATMQLGGTPAGGTKIKTLTVNTDKGVKVLYLKATVLAAPAAMTEMDRTANQNMAKADRQAVFKGDCVKCHVEPAKDAAGHEKMGQSLYAAVCGICHESEHQASFVPNLHHLPEPTNPDFWKNWIMHGKPGTLMPAFAKSEGGILSDQQIISLVQYLTITIPSHPVPANPPANLQIR